MNGAEEAGEQTAEEREELIRKVEESAKAAKVSEIVRLDIVG